MGQFPPFLCRGPFTCTVNASQSISGANHETHRRRCRNRRSRTHRVFIRTCCASDPAGQHDGPDSEPHGDNRAHRSTGGANDRGDPSARVGADRSADSDSTASSNDRTDHAPYRRSTIAYRHAGANAYRHPHDGTQPPENCGRRDPGRPAGLRSRRLEALDGLRQRLPDARQEVLVAESRTTVSYKTDRGCRVSAGQWLEPYTGTVVTDPSTLDVDHMVPLGNAHASGAWRWSPERREQYANYLDDPQHLIAVTASANRSKGARGPQNWKPDDRSYWCQYAVDWVTIKDDWDLTATASEFAALSDMLSTCDVPH